MNIVLLHGFGEDATIWGEFLKKLPSEYNYLYPDFSSLSHLKTIEEYAVWLKSETDQLGWEEMVVIGHSMGGYIALEFAKKYKKTIKGLGLFHSTALPDSGEKKKNRDKTAAAIESKGSIVFISGFYPGMFTEDFKTHNKEFIIKQSEQFGKISEKALIACTLAMKNRKDNLSVLKNLKVPVLQIIGGQDAFIPKEQVIEQTILIAAPYTLVLENIAHAGMFESPDICALFIAEFLKNC